MRVTKMILRQKSVLSLVESLKSDYGGSKSMVISHLDNIGLYKETEEEPPGLI